MDEKTERLRDIFLDIADEATVTESQVAARGSLARETVEAADVEGVVAAMRERYGFATDLDDAALVAVARGFFDERPDAEIARELDASASTVRRARLDLHLVTDRDLDAPFDLDELRALQETAASTAEQAEALDVSPSTVRKYARALDAQRERRLVGDRYREEFERLLGDAELSGRLTASVRETGLRDATEDAETNVSF